MNNETVLGSGGRLTPAILGFVSIASILAVGAHLLRALFTASSLASLPDSVASAREDLLRSVDESHATLTQLARQGDGRDTAKLAAKARATDGRIYRIVDLWAEMVREGPAGAKRFEFEDAWREYGQLRERAILLAEAGDTEGVRSIAAGEAATALADAKRAVKELDDAIEDAMIERQRAIPAILRELSIDVTLLGTLAVLSYFTFRWRSRVQDAYLTLRARSEESARAEQLERERGAILEMAGRNEPLTDTLQSLVCFVERQLPGALVEVSAVAGPTVVASDKLAEFEGRSSWVDPEAAARELGFASHWSRDIASSDGRKLGRLNVFVPRAVSEPKRQRLALSESGKLAKLILRQKEMYDRLEYQAHHDPLTELPNRRLFAECLRLVLSRAAQRGRRVGVALVDVDGFKQINDLFGHHVGDEVLRTIAVRLRGWQGEAGIVARMGGDEFVLAIEDDAGLGTVDDRAARVVMDLAAPVFVNGRTVSAGVSLGLSIYPDHATDADTLIRNADLAMYSAKRRTNSGCEIYSPALGSELLRRMEVEKALQSARLEEFAVHYQAIFAPDGRVHAVEALLRWNSPTLGPVSPGEFISVAEESGSIMRIGAWVLREAVRCVAGWVREGVFTGRVAVNISAKQLASPDLEHGVLRVLREEGLSAQHLELEVTETSVMQDIATSVETLRRLRHAGIAVTVDDFGTGYSSLALLHELPAGRLKIDRSFVERIFDQPRSTLPMVRAIVDVAHSLDLDVVAEGVQSGDQLRMVQECGCDAIQGYLLHRPADAQQTSEFLRALRHRRGSLREILAPKRTLVGASALLAAGGGGWNETPAAN